MPKPIHTPPEQLHLVAAILSAGGPAIAPQEGKPNHQANAMAHRFRQYVRMLGREAEESAE